jgi:uncharacterized iron-regulated membrane protein
LRPNTFRRGLQTVHLWLGLILAIPIIIIGVTGSVLLLERELLVLEIPAATATGMRQPLARIVEAAKPAAPEGMTMGRIDVREGAPVAVRFSTSGRPQRTVAVYVDPVSLDVLGPPNPVGRVPLMTSFQRVHEYLWMPGFIGLRFVGYMGLAMTFMGISGLILWWPRGGSWRNAFLMRRGARGLRLYLDLHHVAGFWGSAVLLIVSISGLYLTFPETYSAALGAMIPPAVGSSAEPAPGSIKIAGPVDPDGAIAIANSAVPDAKAVSVEFPGRDGEPVVVTMEASGLAPTIPPIVVTLDPKTAEITFIDDPRRYGLKDRLLNLSYAIHFAVGLPWIWKGLVFLSGLLPLLLAITGASIWWLRRRATRRTTAAEGVAAPAE